MYVMEYTLVVSLKYGFIGICIIIILILGVCILIGSTPLGMYKKLIEFHKAGQLSFQYVTTFNMDEYVSIPEDHPESYHSYMWNNFFKHINIDPKNVHILDGNASDLQRECELFEEKIAAAGGVELFVGGMSLYWWCI